MLKIDIDGFTRMPRLQLQIILYSMPRPFFIRLSSSRTGLHIVVPQLNENDYRRACFDDPARAELDDQRVRFNLPVRNLLFDVKQGKKAGHWQIMTSELNIEHFLDAIETLIIYSERAYKDVCQSMCGSG